MLKLDDLCTDPPNNAKICPRCFGYGVLIDWDGFAQTSKDCPNCDCNGWIIPNKPLDTGPCGVGEHGEDYYRNEDGSVSYQ